MGAEAAAIVLGGVGRAADTEGCVCGRGAVEIGRLGTVAVLIFDGRAVGIVAVVRGRCGKVAANGRVVADAVAVARGRIGTVPTPVVGRGRGEIAPVVERVVRVPVAVVWGVFGTCDVGVAAVGRRVCRTFMALLGGNALATLCEN